ncbi:hypothetical protein FRB98_004591 [Tulasnella sp. 332]|nr:hypothetical protein FRB98_004591 [Tulasnella sp. 332]
MGNVQVDQRHLSLGRDLIVPPVLTPETITPYYRLARCIHQSSTPSDVPLAIMQLNHVVKRLGSLAGAALVELPQLLVQFPSGPETVNAADYVNGGLSEGTAVAHVRGIAEWGMVDFIEISGGDYEKSEFGEKANPRQAFFSSFSRIAMEALPQTEKMPMILLTGSLRTQTLMAHSVRARHANLIGIGRPSVLYPNYPRIILKSGLDHASVTSDPFADRCSSENSSAANRIHYEEAPTPAWSRVLNTSLVGAGIGTAWHCALMGRIATGKWDGLKSRSGEDGDALSIEEVRATPLTRNEMPRIGGIRSLFEMWSP